MVGANDSDWQGKWIDIMWKDILLDCIDDAILFFLPELSEERDKTQKILLAREELPKIDGDSDKGMKIADVALIVPLRGGGEQRVIFLIEQQHERDPGFGKRMFVEYYRMSDRMEVPVTSLAIFTGNAHSDLRYEIVCFGTKLSFEYNTYRVADADVETLKHDERLFAMAVLAAKRMLDAGGDPRKRFLYARELLTLLRERRCGEKKRKDFLFFIERALRLNDKDIEAKAKEELNMITTIPVDEAVEQFRKWYTYEEGKEEGKLETAQRMLALGSDIEFISKATGLSPDEIRSLADKK